MTYPLRHFCSGPALAFHEAVEVLQPCLVQSLGFIGFRVWGLGLRGLPTIL